MVGHRKQTFTANEAKTRFGEFIDLAQREPVRVTRRDRVVGVLVSAQDYESMRAFLSDRLAQRMNTAASQAALAGLTPALLDELLADAGASSAAVTPQPPGATFQLFTTPVSRSLSAIRSAAHARPRTPSRRTRGRVAVRRQDT